MKALLENSVSVLALEARARRAAKRVDLAISKSRWRAGSVDNYGEFMIIDPGSNTIVAGARYDMSAEQVLEYCVGIERNRIAKRHLVREVEK